MLCRLSAAAACAGLLAVTPAAGAATPPPLKTGVYDCMAYNYSSGFLDYKGSIKIKAGRRYEHAFGRKKAVLEDKTTGTYSRRGSRLTFKGGAMDGTKATVRRGTGAKKQPFFDLLVKGKSSGISCYYDATP